MKKSRMKRAGRRTAALAVGFLTGMSADALAARVDPQELEQLRGVVGMLLEDVEEFYHVTILIEAFLIFMLLALIILGIVGYTKLKREVRDLRRHVYGEEAFEPEPQEDLASPFEPLPVVEPEPEPEPAVRAAPAKVLTPLERFMEAYGEANGIEDAALREARLSSLLAEFPIQTFTCTNPEARKLDPNAPPTFESRDEGDFWALKKDGDADDYHVVPNPALIYNEERHRFCGMKEAFASNYQEGKEYTHMTLDAPARFNLMGKLWAPLRPGKITLSGEREA